MRSRTAVNGSSISRHWSGLPEDLMQICPVGAYLRIVVVESHNLAWYHENDPVWVVAGTTGAPSCIEKFLSLENFASIQISIVPTVFCDDDKLTGKIHSLGYGRCCRQDRDAICTLIERPRQVAAPPARAIHDELRQGSEHDSRLRPDIDTLIRRVPALQYEITFFLR